jgi:hypothetical protein
VSPKAHTERERGGTESIADEEVSPALASVKGQAASGGAAGGGRAVCVCVCHGVCVCVCVWGGDIVRVQWEGGRANSVMPQPCWMRT